MQYLLECHIASPRASTPVPYRSIFSLLWSDLMNVDPIKQLPLIDSLRSANYANDIRGVEEIMLFRVVFGFQRI